MKHEVDVKIRHTHNHRTHWALLAVVFCMALHGCDSGPAYDKDKIEEVLKETYTKQMRDKGLPQTVVSAPVIQDSQNKDRFIGYVEYSDGVRINVEVIMDPESGKFLMRPTSP